MNNRRRGDHSESIVGLYLYLCGFVFVFGFVGVFVDVFVFVTVAVGVAVFAAVVVFFFDVDADAAVRGVSELVRERRRAAHLRAIPPLAPRTLRRVRGLLPGDEGAAWLAEVGSCLTETTDEGERRRYVRSYRRGVPRLIWTSWTEHLSASHRRSLS